MATDAPRLRIWLLPLRNHALDGAKRCHPPRKVFQTRRQHGFWLQRSRCSRQTGRRGTSARASGIAPGRIASTDIPWLMRGFIFLKEYIQRDCRTCWKIRSKRGGTITPEVLGKVTVALKHGATIKSFTGAGSSTYLVMHSTFSGHQRENPEFDRLEPHFVVFRDPAQPTGIRFASSSATAPAAVGMGTRSGVGATNATQQCPVRVAAPLRAGSPGATAATRSEQRPTFRRQYGNGDRPGRTNVDRGARCHDPHGCAS
jgi:hypothetical protein